MQRIAMNRLSPLPTPRRGAARRGLLAFALLTAALLHAGCGGGGGGGTGAAAVATGAETAVIRGTVRDYATGNPVVGATVSLSTADAAPALAPLPGAPSRSLASTVTDEAGAYRFAGVAPGNYLVAVTGPGGLAAIYPAVAQAGVETTASPELTPVARVSGSVSVPHGIAGPVRVSIPGTGFLALVEPAGGAPGGVATAPFAFEGVPIRRDADPAYPLKIACTGMATARTAFTLRLAELGGTFAKALPAVALVPAVSNRPPEIASLTATPPSATAVPAVVVLTATVADADGDTVSVAWVQVEGPTASPAQGAGLSLTVTAASAGTYRYLATATDQLGLVSDPASVAFTVAPDPTRNGPGRAVTGRAPSVGFDFARRRWYHGAVAPDARRPHPPPPKLKSGRGTRCTSIRM